MGDLDAFVIERIREIGKDPRLVRKAIDAARRVVKEETPALWKELRRLNADKERLESGKKNIVDAVAVGGKGADALLPRLGEVEAELQKLMRRIDECRAEIAALEQGTIDEKDLRQALAAFDPVWDQLFPQEKARVMRLLVERVTYDAESEEVSISFRPGGVRVLAQDEKKETA